MTYRYDNPESMSVEEYELWCTFTPITTSVRARAAAVALQKLDPSWRVVLCNDWQWHATRLSPGRF